MKSIEDLICKISRVASRKMLPFQAYIHRNTRKFRKTPHRLGIYSAYYNSSVYLEAHLKCVQKNTHNKFDYYLMKNYTKRSESEKFDDIVARFPFVTVFDGSVGRIPCPNSHSESLQRMVSMTDNEIVVICDIDSFFISKGWDEKILTELELRDLVAVVAYFEKRTNRGQIPLVAHPSFMAFSRQFLENNKLDLYGGEGNDPAYKITRFLMESGRFDQTAVSPLLASHVDFPNGYFPEGPVFGSYKQPSHGFCTRYGDFFFHFWHSMNFSDGRDIMADDGTVLVRHEDVKERVRYYCKLFADHEC